MNNLNIAETEVTAKPSTTQETADLVPLTVEQLHLVGGGEASVVTI